MKTTIPKGDDFLPHTTKSKLRQTYRKETDLKAKTRLLVLIMRKEGTAIREIERTMYHPYTTVRNWLVRAVRYGLDGVYDQKRDGPECRMNQKQLGQLRDDLIAGPQKCGFGHGIWTSPLVVMHVKRKYGVKYTDRGMYDLLHRIGFSSKKPRPRHPRAASEPERDKFKKS